MVSKKKNCFSFLISFWNYWLKRVHFNRSSDIRYLIADFNTSLLTAKLQLGLPYRNVWINWSLLWNKICLLIFLILFKWDCLGVWKLGQWRKKCAVVSVSLPQSHNGVRVTWKHCLNLQLRRWPRPSCILVKSLIPYGLWILKILIAQGLIKLSRFILKIERLPEFLILPSRLFHSDIVEGNNDFLK